MTKSVPERFEKFMATKGIFTIKRTREGARKLPTSPMSPKSVEGFMSRFKKLMKDLGYMRMDGQGMKATWSILPGTDWTKISVDELENWLIDNYGNLEKCNINTRNGYCKMIKKFAQFMHFEFRPRGKPGFSARKMEKIDLITTLIPVQSGRFIINSPDKAHAFATWLMDHANPLHQIYGKMIHIGQWFGLRYEEVVLAPADFIGKTVNVDFDRDWITVWGKGRYGKKERGLPLSEEMKAWCKDLLAWRKDQEVDHDKMFFSPRTRRPYKVRDPCGFNEMLRKLARQYNDQVSDPEKRLDISLVKSHMIMRHVYGTYFGPILPEMDLMDYMGLDDHKTVQRYINPTDKERIERYHEIHNGLVHPQIVRDEVRTARKEKASLSKNGFTGGIEELKEKAEEMWPEKAGAIVKLLEAVEELAQ
ncbi:MAG: site-specific integrase [Candidatus Aenigmatarchaeota archaeon]|nr:MAG: site-specific integrase [Candidatus Aenigmarchaeota archaeon]